MRSPRLLILCGSALFAHMSVPAQAQLEPDLRPNLRNPLDRSQCTGALSALVGQPGLPDSAANAEVSRVERALGAAAPDAAPEDIRVPQDGPNEDWDKRRGALSRPSVQARVHIAALVKVRGQIGRLTGAVAATGDLTELRDAQTARAATGMLPGRKEFAEAEMTPLDCDDFLTTAKKATFREATSDLRFGRPFTTLELTTGVDDAVVPEAGLAAYDECQARRAGGEKLIKCPSVPPLDAYYVVFNPKCSFEGWLPGVGGQPPRRGCIARSDANVPAPPPAEVRKFHDAVEEVRRRATRALPKFQARESQLISVDRSSAVQLNSLLSLESARLAQWRVELDQLHRQIEQDHADADVRTHARDSALKDQQTHEPAAAELAAQIATEEKALDSNDQTLDAIASQLAENQAKKDAVVLQCGGATYAACSDEEAKLAYDRQLYEIQEERNKLRAAEQAARADTHLRRDRLRQSEQSQRAEERGAQLAEAEAAVQDALLKVTVAKLDLEEKRFAAEDPHNRRLADENGRDRDSVAKLASLIGVSLATFAPANVGQP
jgi:hypothetical protein